jgi:hypothetical protein
MVTAILNYAAHDQIGKMSDQTDELIERYEQDEGPLSAGRVLKSFVPLLDALKDPQAPRRGEALDHFAKSDNWVTLRWIWIQKYKLSTDDAIRFLGGKETDAYRRVLVLYLQKNQSAIGAAHQAYIEGHSFKGMGRVLASWLARDLCQAKGSIEEVDLRPANAKSVRQAVLDVVKREQ